jgi:hypothetical protein
MTNFRLFYCFFCFQTLPLFSLSQQLWKGFEHLFLPPQSYVVYQTSAPISIDGKANEMDWSKAECTAPFIDIEGDSKPKPTYATRVKMLWNKQGLYLFAELEEPHIWAYYRQHDQIVYHENDFEIFIDPDRDSQNYFEFEVNAANTLFDLFLPKPYRDGGNPLLTWDAHGFKSAVSIDGTLNNPADGDKKWSVELFIPFSSLQAGNVKTPVPASGEVWKIDFSRVEWQTLIADGKYLKKKDDKTGKFLNENNWVWNATGEINMHVPERWGMIQFSEEAIGSGKVQFQTPADEELKKLLWLVYYKQAGYKRTNGNYAQSLAQISVPEKISLDSGIQVNFDLTVTESGYLVTLTTGAGGQFSMNENGLLEAITTKQ